MTDPESRRARARPKKREERRSRWKRYLLVFLAVVVIFLMTFTSLMPLFTGR
jgi:uncharacterized protein YpmS